MTKRFLAAATAIVATVALAAPTAAFAAQPTLAQLSRKVTTLQQKVTKLERRVAELEEGLWYCIFPTPVTQYGGLADEGYMYAVGQTVYLETALDLVDDTTGLVPGQDFGFFAEIDPECATVAARASEGWSVQRRDPLAWTKLRNRR